MTFATLCIRKRLQLYKMPGHNVLCCAARRARLFLCSTRVFSSRFCTHFSPRFLTRGKSPVCPGKKTGGKNSIAGAGPLSQSGPGGPGRNGGPGRDGGPGPGQGRAGGRGTCVFLHKTLHRNRLECRFGTVCLGKKLYFSPDFFRDPRGRYRIFPSNMASIYRIFPDEKSGKIEGKSGTITVAQAV